MAIVVEETSTSTNSTSELTHTITMPTGSGATNLFLLAFTSEGQVTTTTTPAGWSICNGTVDAVGSTDYKDVETSQGNHSLFYRYSSAAISDFDITVDAASRTNHLCMRISGVENASAPVFSLTSTNAGGTTSLDSPSLTHGLGSTGIMGLCLLQHYRENRTVSSYPLTDNQQKGSTSFPVPGNTVCTQIFDSATIDPGTYTMSGSIANHTIATIALKPGAGGGSNIVPIIVVQQQN